MSVLIFLKKNIKIFKNMCIQLQQTTWVVLGLITTHIPSFVTVAHTEIWIFAIFVFNHWERICKWGIKYVLLLTTDQVGSPCAHHYPHIPSFITVAHTELWIFDVTISQSEQICKWGIKYAHLVMTDHMGSTCAPHYPHTKFYENQSMRSH